MVFLLDSAAANVSGFLGFDLALPSALPAQWKHQHLYNNSQQGNRRRQQHIQQGSECPENTQGKLNKESKSEKGGSAKAFISGHFEELSSRN